MKYVKIQNILVGVLCVGIFAVSFFLYHLPLRAVLYPAALCAVLVGIWWGIGCLRRKKHHEQMKLARKCLALLPQGLPQPESLQEEDYRELVEGLAETLQTRETEMNRRYENMVDYYTVWAHQIKTPISSMGLKLENEDSLLARELRTDLLRIQQYVEMVLMYLRLDADSTDYVFRSCDLDEVLRGAVKKFSGEFIGRKLQLTFVPTEAKVLTDEKWLSFVVEQILSNGLKYTRTGGITIEMKEPGCLSISDTGIGIAPEDLPRIFEKGYTGFNGRRDQRASGIGLYLCKRVCQNLGITIEAESRLGEGSTFTLKFPREQQL